MAGCTDLSFRLIARESGAKVCFFEMVDTNALIYNNPGTFRLLKTTEEDVPLAAQLLGSDAEGFMRAAEKLITLAPRISFLDINSACPAGKALKKGAGAELLDNPELLASIVKILSSELPVPVTVKLRIGHTKKDPALIRRTARSCEDNGAAALFVHGRTALQGYRGAVDYESIAEIKRSVKIPVFGSGNIFSAEDAENMFRETGCDGILVARGSLGNPWIFGEIETFLKTGEKTPAPAPAAKSRCCVNTCLTWKNTGASLLRE